MPMDPKKLKSYMAAKQDDEELEGEEPEGEELEGEEPEGEEPEDEEAEFGDDMEVVDEEGFNEFMGELFTHIDDVAEAASDVAEQLTHDSQPSEETVEQMKSQLEPMPQEIKDGIADYIKGMEWEDVMKIAQQFAEADHIDDPEQVCGWLYWLAKNV